MVIKKTLIGEIQDFKPCRLVSSWQCRDLERLFLVLCPTSQTSTDFSLTMKLQNTVAAASGWSFQLLSEVPRTERTSSLSDTRRRAVLRLRVNECLDCVGLGRSFCCRNLLRRGILEAKSPPTTTLIYRGLTIFAKELVCKWQLRPRSIFELHLTC